jgi:hemerythrin-like domain-containing protein
MGSSMDFIRYGSCSVSIAEQIIERISAEFNYHHQPLTWRNAMSRPTHLLKHEHRVIEQALRGLEGICFRLRTGVVLPEDELAKALDFVDHFIDKFHHSTEETLLFPVLERLGLGSKNGSLLFLRGEHDRERQLLSELERAVGADPCDSTSERFVLAALQFKDHLINHMQKEEAILFPLLEEMMEISHKDSLLLALHKRNTDWRELIERYENLAGELERKWSV